MPEIHIQTSNKMQFHGTDKNTTQNTNIVKTLYIMIRIKIKLSCYL